MTPCASNGSGKEAFEDDGSADFTELMLAPNGNVSQGQSLTSNDVALFSTWGFRARNRFSKRCGIYLANYDARAALSSLECGACTDWTR